MRRALGPDGGCLFKVSEFHSKSRPTSRVVQDEDEDEDEDEAFCLRHNEIFKNFRLQLGRDDEVDCNNNVTPSLSWI